MKNSVSSKRSFRDLPIRWLKDKLKKKKPRKSRITLDQ